MRWFAAGVALTAAAFLATLLAALGTALTLAFAEDPDDDQENP